MIRKKIQIFHRKSKHSGRKDPWSFSFTLIELLVVITIVAVLASLLMPAISVAKKQAQSSGCVSNLRQIGLGISMYGQDTGRYPPSTDLTDVDHPDWTYVISRNLGMANSSPTAGPNSRSPVLCCPASDVKTTNRVCNYGIHYFMVNNEFNFDPDRYGIYPYPYRPSETLLVADCDVGSDGEGLGLRGYWWVLENPYDAAVANQPAYPMLWGAVRFRHKENVCANVLFVDNHVSSVETNKLSKGNLQLGP